MTDKIKLDGLYLMPEKSQMIIFFNNSNVNAGHIYINKQIISSEDNSG